MKLLIMRKGLVFFLVISIIVISCSEDVQITTDLGSDYYPLQVGNYSIFQVKETSISQSVEVNTSYELKVSVKDSTINGQGLVTYYLVREKRMNPSDKWKSLDVWTSKVVANRIIQNEGNILFVKLVFPPSLNLMWDGNEYNNLPNDGNIFNDNDSSTYVISELNKPLTFPTGFESDQTLTVIQNDFTDNIIGIDQRKEFYSKGVGLVYKEIIQLVYCTSSNCLGQQKVANGIILTQSLKENGKI